MSHVICVHWICMYNQWESTRVFCCLLLRFSSIFIILHPTLIWFSSGISHNHISFYLDICFEMLTELIMVMTCQESVNYQWIFSLYGISFSGWLKSNQIFRKSRTCIHTPGYPPLVPNDLSESSLSLAINGAKIVFFDGRSPETAFVIAQEEISFLVHYTHS